MRIRVIVVVLGLAALLLVLVGVLAAGRSDPPSETGPGADPAPAVASEEPVRGPAENPNGDLTLSEDLWPEVDWDDVRARTPGSLVWTETWPADTDAERKRRVDAAVARNERWGRIQAGVATEEEIEAYFEAKRRLLSDNLEFVGILLEDYRDQIPERDEGLLEMSFAMTGKRLRQLPTERERAYEWKSAREQKNP